MFCLNCFSFTYDHLVPLLPTLHPERLGDYLISVRCWQQCMEYRSSHQRFDLHLLRVVHEFQVRWVDLCINARFQNRSKLPMIELRVFSWFPMDHAAILPSVAWFNFSNSSGYTNGRNAISFNTRTWWSKPPMSSHVSSISTWLGSRVGWPRNGFAVRP